MSYTKLITNRDIYEEVILEHIPEAKRFVWIGTADIKDLYVKKNSRMVPFLEILSDLLTKVVEVRVIYAKEPGKAFQKDFDRYPVLAKQLEQFHCPRVHFKTVIIDGEYAFTGSSNLTGAGMGAKSKDNRNFEAGVVSNDKSFIEPLMQLFDEVWMGANCKTCGRKQYCNEWRSFV